MSVPHQALIAELARLRGLGEAYYDHRGELRYFSNESRSAILRAMGAAVDDENALREAIDDATKSQTSCSHDEVSASRECFEPQSVRELRRWGLSIQLYTLRSDRNWGIGDFGDLRELIEFAAPLGCDLIGLNPLHALFPSNPRQCSPYSPSNRLFLNVLYVAIDMLPEFETCAAAQALYSQPQFQIALNGLRTLDNVMYEPVTTLKVSVLRLLHSDFRDVRFSNDDARAREFTDFVAQGGRALRLHALFCALDAHFRESGIEGWRQWPVEFRDPDSAAVREFASEHEDEIDFHIYTQWLADGQLAAAHRFALEQGMRIGLYGDLAVGANADGSEVWSNPSLYVLDASVGAPPDPLALNGQDWGIPPIDPHALRAQDFGPFRELLRANMRRVGALRIDHVMSLFRLWWVPRGAGATEGVYVHYPLDRLLQILANESTRAECIVIGEDLGTVPDEMRRAMAERRLYRYKVLLFEKRDDGLFKSPQEYERRAVATATTHDLPPLQAWWQGDDLALRDRLNLYPSADTADRLRTERTADRHALMRALNDANLWHWQGHEPLPEFSPALARAIHLYLGASQTGLVLVQLEDLIGMTDPVNVPGTYTEHANWQRKLAASTRDIFSSRDVRETLTALGKARTGLNPNE